MRARIKLNSLNAVRVQVVVQESHCVYLLSCLVVKIGWGLLFSLKISFSGYALRVLRFHKTIRTISWPFSFWRSEPRFRLLGVLLEIWKHGKDHLDLENWVHAKYGICCVYMSYCLLSCSVSFHQSHRFWCFVTITSGRSNQCRDEMRMGLQCHQLEVWIRDESAYS